ncbi:hypothetical protein PINS_up008053 [Pythium insidiosum]|nr:hypothetical protein PINS_up008053 [Pythium insidiosum]
MCKSVEREVICLEDILMNHRFANFFWVFLFPHNYHREIAFWLDVEYEFKPAHREYISIARTKASSREDRDMAARNCKKLVRYICEKYYPGDEEMRQLDRSVSRALARLQHEQDRIIAKFNLIHLELYHRFLTSRAFTEFALYPASVHATPEGSSTTQDEAESMDDLQRLSGLLLSYGLRAHHWPEEASRDALRKRSLEVLETTRGYEAICGVVSFEGIATEEQRTAGTATLHIASLPLPHDPTPSGFADHRAIESFLLPWCNDPSENVVLHAPSCPPPIAFNFKMGDSSSSGELYAACVVIYRPAPPLPNSYFEKVRINAHYGSASRASNNAELARWVPYGVCVFSKFALIDLLRERIAEAYDFVIESKAIDAASRSQSPTPTSATGSATEEQFKISKKVLSKLSRSVSLETSCNPNSSLPSMLSIPPTVRSTSGSSLINHNYSMHLPRLDHSLRILFDALDLSTILQVFTAVLFESRLLIVSSHLSVLMRVCESLRALLFPLLWPHVYLPLLPRRMLPYLDCPTPFIFGVSRDAYHEAFCSEWVGDEVYVVDVDKGCVTQGRIPHQLPDQIMHPLREGLLECLKPNFSKSDHVFAHRFPPQPFEFPELAVRRLFSSAVQDLVGDFGYHRYVWTDEFSGKKTVFFDEASYLAASAPEMREFRTLFIATQAFSEFVVSFHGFEEILESRSSSDKSGHRADASTRHNGGTREKRDSRERTGH